MAVFGGSLSLAIAGCTGRTGEGTGANGDGGEDGTDGESAGSATGTEDSEGGTGSAGTGGGTGNDEGESDVGSNGDGDGGGDHSSGNPRLRDVFAWDASYVMEMESPDGTGTWIVHDGDAYMKWESGSDVVESYMIGTDHYSVMDGECYKFSFDMPASDHFDPEEPQEDDQEYVADGTEQLDGETVYRFDVGDGYYFISAVSGYPVRFVSHEDGSVVTLHSWGNTDPISPPEMDCREP